MKERKKKKRKKAKRKERKQKGKKEKGKSSSPPPPPLLLLLLLLLLLRLYLLPSLSTVHIIITIIIIRWCWGATRAHARTAACAETSSWARLSASAQRLTRYAFIVLSQNRNIDFCRPSVLQGTYCEQDMDECTLLDACSPHATCANFVGGYKCKCNAGYSGDGIICSDIDECKVSLS